MSEKPVALVTGARKGIGRYLAERLLEKGYRVAGCSREPSDLQSEEYLHVTADVTDEKQVSALIGGIRRRFGRLDVLINNAGIASMNHVLLVPGPTVDRIFSTNLRGTFLVSRECAKLMRKRSFGRIVNLTTVAVPMALEGEALYVASKSAVEALTRVMCRELAAFGITVNAVGPGPVETDLLKSVPGDKIQAILDRLAIKRFTTPEDIFGVIDFFIRPESGCVTGQVVYLGGP
jgi:3-oxoacyl-[acyl-carrier protein] reductase